MSSSLFHITDHVLPCQHIRSYPNATRHEDEEVLHLAIKQYIPVDNPRPKRGDITIIGAHANGFPKELYEPLWDDLLQQSKAHGFRIRSIWIADVAHQGQSSVINEDKLGNAPSWFDHPRDLLHMINHFRAEMPRPLVGVGHSMGGAHLINLALIHPRLLETLVLIDPVASQKPSIQGNWVPAVASARRRDRWPSRKAAKESFKRSKFYQTWDPRVLDRWVKYGLRELPTKLYPDAQPSPAATGSTVSLEPTVTPNVAANHEEKEVTLTTTKHQEVLTFLRVYEPTEPGEPPKEIMHPDLPLYDDQDPVGTLYRPEPTITWHNLPFLRPSVHYVFGETSIISALPFRTQKMELTGTGTGGSGGAKKGRVVGTVMKDTGHLIPMEKVGQTATLAATWLGLEMARWRENEELLKEYWSRVPEKEKYTLDARYQQGFAAMGLTRPPKAVKPDADKSKL